MVVVDRISLLSSSSWDVTTTQRELATEHTRWWPRICKQRLNRSYVCSTSASVVVILYCSTRPPTMRATWVRQASEHLMDGPHTHFARPSLQCHVRRQSTDYATKCVPLALTLTPHPARGGPLSTHTHTSYPREQENGIQFATVCVVTVAVSLLSFSLDHH